MKPVVAAWGWIEPRLTFTPCAKANLIELDSEEVNPLDGGVVPLVETNLRFPSRLCLFLTYVEI